MLMKRWGMLGLLLLCCAAALAAGNLVVTGQTVLTPASVPAYGYQSVTVAPGGELILLAPAGATLTINVKEFVDIAGAVRVLGVSSLAPVKLTANGGAVLFNLPTGVFTVSPSGAIIAAVLDAGGQPKGNGGTVTVKADSISVAGLIVANGNPVLSCARGGVIELNAKNVVTVENPAEDVTGTLATLSAYGYTGGIVRLLTGVGAVTLADTSLVDVRGVVGLAFTAACPYSNASLIDIAAGGGGALLAGFRVYGVEKIATGIGHLYAAARGPITVTALPPALLQAQAYAEYAEHADVVLALPRDHFAAIVTTATHLGDVLFRADFNGPLDIYASNAVIVEDGTLGSCFTAKVGGYLMLLDGRILKSAAIQTSRLYVDGYTLPTGATVSETGKPVSFANDTFRPNEVYTTPCGLKLTGSTIGAGAYIGCEGPLTITGSTIGADAILEAGRPFATDFARNLPCDTEIFKLTGGKLGNNVTITISRPPDYPANKALSAAVTGTECGTSLELRLPGSLKASGFTAGDACELWVPGDLKLTGSTFGAGTVHCSGTVKCTGTQDGQLTYTDTF